MQIGNELNSKNFKMAIEQWIGKHGWKQIKLEKFIEKIRQLTARQTSKQDNI